MEGGGDRQANDIYQTKTQLFHWFYKNNKGIVKVTEYIVESYKHAGTLKNTREFFFKIPKFLYTTEQCTRNKFTISL